MQKLYALGLCRKCYEKDYYSRPGKAQKRKVQHKKSRKKCVRMCDQCGKARTHSAQGLCSACYNKILYTEQSGLRMQHIRASLYGKEAANAFSEAIIAQNGKCAICDQEANLVLDHDHETEEFRGAICHKCNAGLGMFGDDPGVVEKALNYLISARLETGRWKNA